VREGLRGLRLLPRQESEYSRRVDVGDSVEE